MGKFIFAGFNFSFLLKNSNWKRIIRRIIVIITRIIRIIISIIKNNWKKNQPEKKKKGQILKVKENE